MLRKEPSDFQKSKAFEDGRWIATPPPGEEIVISGLAGVYPESDNVYEFRDNLYNKVDMVSCDNRRWDPTHPEIPQRTGKIKNIEKFDAGFFGVHYRQAHSMDPMCRLFLERAIEAILDAGYNPSDFEGSNTGVYLGACFSETEKTWFFDKLESQYFVWTGIERSMIPNRLSYYLKLKGPSTVVDTACSSSLSAVEVAYRAIRSGHCERAIVGGSGVCLHPFVSLQFARLGVLSIDGSCKVFDVNGDGYARSEAVAAILLEKSKDAKRVYAHVVHAKTNCDGYKQQGITFPSGNVQKKLLQEFYQECAISPYSLSFLEAHGTGTKVGDPEECIAIDEVFCKGRSNPLLVGSVKSSIGHSEASSGLCSITKCLIGFENELIPPNINYTKPREGVEPLEKGRLKVVTEKIPFQDDHGLVGVNSFGFGGGNCHVLLRWNTKLKNNNGIPKDRLPRLICVSGRLEKSIFAILDDIKSRPIDEEFVALLHNVFRKNIEAYLYRGFGIFSEKGEIVTSWFHLRDGKKPLTLCFTSFGPLWKNLVEDLCNFGPFMESVKRIHNILDGKVNLLEIIQGSSPNDRFNQIMGTMAVQIALVDILKMLKLKPDAILGVGLGEFICAYYDNCLTLEETVFSIHEIASKSQLNINLKPKYRTKWVPLIDEEISKNYFLKALGKNFTFNDLTEKISKGNVVFEIGYQLQFYGPILQISCNVNYLVGFLEVLGRLYEFGQDLHLAVLYPKVDFPVSRGTPMISPIIKWNHNHDWFVTKYQAEDTLKSGERTIGLTLKEEDWQFVAGHIIDGRNLFPATGYLNLAWEALGLINGMMTSDMQVVFENCKFIRAVTIPKDSKTELIIMVQRGTGNFEVIESGQAVVTGRITMKRQFADEQVDLPIPLGIYPDESLSLKSKDIYKELRLRGYNYKGEFKKLTGCNDTASKGTVEWDGNWITFMDNILQMKILQMDTRFLYVPTSIRRLTVDAKRHIAYAKSIGGEKPQLPVYVNSACDVIKCGAIEIRGLNATSIARKRPLGEPVLEKYVFVPSISKLKVRDAVKVNMQLGLENAQGFKPKVVELVDEACSVDYEPLSPFVQEALGDLPLIQPDITILTARSLPNITDVKTEDKKLVAEVDCFVVIATKVFERPIVFDYALKALKNNGYILSREDSNFDPSIVALMEVLTVYELEREKLVFARRKTEFKTPTIIDIDIDFRWLSQVQESIKNGDGNIILLSKTETNGVLGLTNCIRREPGCSNVKCVALLGDAPPFDPKHPFYRSQLQKNLSVNVYKNSQWGTYRHLNLEESALVESEHCFVNVKVPGDLSTLRWIEGPLSHKSILPPEKTLVNIYCSALNFRDVMTASGRISADVITLDRTKQECVQGFEFAGRTANGQRVTGMVTSAALATLVAADAYLLWPIPDSWSMAEAATLPVVYGTVIYAFFMRCHVRKGQSILIHSGSGGVGQAAISLALHYGLKVFTTVGTKEKRKFLKKRFPQLTDRNIGSSRDTTFENMIKVETHGRGVDYVLNSLAEEKLQASVRCLSSGGSFLEIGKFDLASNNELKLLLLEKEASFHGIMLDQLFIEVPSVKETVGKLMLEGIKHGAVKPLPRTLFKPNEIEKAFRYMATGKHVGKVLIEVRKEERERNVPPTIQTFKGSPRYHCNPESVYIILGGLGGFGLELADWLVLRGARKLVLNSRNGIKNGYQSYRIKIWKSYGATIKISTANITTKKGVENVIYESSKLGPIHAVFNLAVVLRDALLENQNIESFATSFAPKAVATQYLDEATRRLCPDLRDFVVFSSVSCGRGNAGQTNYGMANSIMERICEKRRNDGLPGLAIQWGAVGDVGLVAELQEEHQELEIGGTLQQRITNCLQVLDRFLKQENPIVSSMVVAEKRGWIGGADNVVDAVRTILGLKDLKTISLHATLAELGMDSMSAVEIKQTLEREFEVFLTPQDIRNMTFARLQEIQNEKDDDITNHKKKEKNPTGFEMILTHINDEKSSKLPIVQLPNKKGEKAGSKVIFFPGIEGVARILEPLTSNLNVDCVGVQFSIEYQEHTICDMAESMLSIVEDLLTPNEPFQIVAYSFGVVVALEVVALLESKGYSGTLICIDGAPQMLVTLQKSQLDLGSEPLFQTSLLCQLMTTYMSSEIILKNYERIFSARSYEDRMNICVEISPKDIDYSFDYLKKVAVAVYRRLKALTDYTPTYKKIHSKVLLLKPTNMSILNLDEDYKLGEMCEQEVDVKVFSGNHFTILENTEAADVINEVFGSKRVFSKDSLVVNTGDIMVPEVKQI